MIRKTQELSNYYPSAHPQQEISRILTAAVVNAHFRHMLLTNPAGAIASGYGGEAFHLDKEEKSCLASIHANSLADFASQIANVTRGPNKPFMYQAGD